MAISTAASAECDGSRARPQDGAVITQVSVPIDPINDSSLPANQPVVELIRVDNDNPSANSLGSVQDAQGSSAAYAALHTIDLPGLSVTVNRDIFNYYARTTTESGAGASASTNYFPPIVTMTVTQVHPGGG